MPTIIAPSILACDLTALADSLRRAEAAGADWHHLDIMDGHFVPNLTFGPDICKAVRKASDHPIDVHLMVTHPQNFAESFIRAGATIVTFHIEALPDPRPLIDRIHALGAQAGLVIKPATPAQALFPYLPEIDMVLVMTVEPGFTGQKFMPECGRKAAILRRHTTPQFLIQVDGGISPDTAPQVAGANVAVAGAALYWAHDMRAEINRLRLALEGNPAPAS